MKSAEIDHELDKIIVKGWVEMPSRPSFNARMIAKLTELSSPFNAVSLRRVQQVAKYLTDLGIAEFQNPTMCGNTPYYSTAATEMILVKLKFKVKK